MRRAATLLPLLAALALPPAAQAQDAGAPLSLTRPADFMAALKPATLSLSAAGEVRLAPDQAIIQLGVNATAATAGEASRLQAERMTRVLAALRAAGLTGPDVQTTQLSLQAQFVYEQNQPPRLTGYQAVNQVVVRVRDLRRLGAAVDAATTAGANEVGGISFGLADASRAEDEARVKAVRLLQARAKLYADASGQRLGRLQSLSESGGYQPEPPRQMMAKAAFASQREATPIEAGEVLVRVEASAIWEMAPR